MELKDIVILVVAVIAWIYSSYRNFQKESAKKIKKVSEVQPEPSFPATTVKQRIPTPKPEPLRREIKEIKPLGSSYKRVPTGSLEWMTNDISVDGSLNKVSSLNVDTFGVDKINSPDEKSNNKEHANTDLIEEIHSGKTDWRKAIVLSEVIRPVYF